MLAALEISSRPCRARLRGGIKFKVGGISSRIELHSPCREARAVVKWWAWVSCADIGTTSYSRFEAPPVPLGTESPAAGRNRPVIRWLGCEWRRTRPRQRETSPWRPPPGGRDQSLPPPVRSSPPADKIEGTQRPTKSPRSRSPENQSQIERQKEIPAAAKNRAFEALTRLWTLLVRMLGPELVYV